jgi:hypothetical protein
MLNLLILDDHPGRRGVMKALPQVGRNPLLEVWYFANKTISENRNPIDDLIENST